MSGHNGYHDAARLACRTAFEKKGEDVVLLDIRDAVSADFLVIATCRSKAHGKALALAIQETLDDFPLQRRGIEGYPDSPWILLDYYGVVVHIFAAEDRDYYGLERRWHDAKIERFEEGFVR